MNEKWIQLFLIDDMLSDYWFLCFSENEDNSSASRLDMAALHNNNGKW